MSFSDSAILRHIARQPKKTASHKQLLRELGVKAWPARIHRPPVYVGRKGELLQVDRDRYAIPHTAKGRNLFSAA